MIVHLPDIFLLVLSANKKENLTGSLFCFIASRACKTLREGQAEISVHLSRLTDSV